MSLQDIAENLEYNEEGDTEDFWQKYSRKTGLRKIVDSLEEIDGSEERVEDESFLHEIEEHAYSLIEYKLSSILDERYEDWPGEGAAFEEWPAVETQDFLDNISKESIEYRAYSRVRDRRLEEADELPESEFPSVEDIIPES